MILILKFLEKKKNLNHTKPKVFQGTSDELIEDGFPLITNTELIII